jgi:hypothetical protein
MCNSPKAVTGFKTWNATFKAPAFANVFGYVLGLNYEHL